MMGDMFANHEILIDLVETYLIPKIEENHVIEIIHVVTTHNPIRITKIDGISIDCTNTNSSESIYISPEFVEIDVEEYLLGYEYRKEANNYGYINN